MQLDLPEYLTGRLDSGTSEDIRKHLSGCETCTSTLRDLRVVIEHLNDLPRDSGLPPVHGQFLTSLNREIDRRSSGKPAHVVPYMVGIPAVAALVLAFLTIVRFSTIPPETHAGFHADMSRLLSSLDSLQISTLQRQSFGTTDLQSGLDVYRRAAEFAADDPTGDWANEFFREFSYSQLLATSADYLASEEFYDLYPVESILQRDLPLSKSPL